MLHRDYRDQRLAERAGRRSSMLADRILLARVVIELDQEHYNEQVIEVEHPGAVVVLLSGPA